MIEKLMKKEAEEPTHAEIYDSMQRVYAYFEERFNLVDARMDQRFGLVDDRLNNIEVRLGTVERDMKEVKGTLAGIQEDLTTLSVAFDRDAETLVIHERRIGRLEEQAKVA